MKQMPGKRLLASAAVALLLQPHAGAVSLCPSSEPIQFSHHEFGGFYGRGKGIDVDLVSELARRSGCRFAETLKPRARIWRELEEGVTDMAGNGIETPQRNRFAAFIPYMAVRAHLLYRGNDKVPASIDELLERPGIKVGIVRSFLHGDPYDAALEQLRQQGQVVEARDMEQLFGLMYKRRIHAIISHPVIYQHYLPEMEITGLQVSDLAIGLPMVKASLVLSRKRFSNEQIAGWTRLLQSIRDDGTLRGIFARHVGEPHADAAMRLHAAPHNSPSGGNAQPNTR